MRKRANGRAMREERHAQGRHRLTAESIVSDQSTAEIDENLIKLLLQNSRKAA